MATGRRKTNSASARDSAARSSIDAAFGDLLPPLDTAQAMVEASRCLYCYDAPCIKACPTAIDIPTFIHQIRTGNVAGSAKTILSANIMGGTCARACPTEILCERACVLNHDESEPIRIGRLQRHAVDYLMAEGGPHPFERASETGRRIAVVGAGPAGLAFAHEAAVRGHDVTVFEARPKPGGLNEYGLAAYKMADDFAQAEVAFLLQIGGVRIVHGKRLGGNLSLDELRHGFDAVFLGIGLTATRPLDIAGEDLPEVRDAIDFIAELRQCEPKSRMALSGDVVVIGGGNTAIDAAVQSKRLGADMVTLTYRRGAEHMSATAWEQDLARLEGVVFRHWLRPMAVGPREGGGLEVTFERTHMRDGRLVGTGAILRLGADLVLKAIGQVMLPAGLEGLDLDCGRIRVDDAYRTSLPGVFAGGDCIATTVDLTVQAVEDGKRAAQCADAYLRNRVESKGRNDG